jgi:alpha-beta hydrolase superfamily lysophospholipase
VEVRGGDGYDTDDSHPREVPLPLDHITVPDGTSLARYVWAPIDPPRGTVVIVHGLGEHGGRYAHVAACLTAACWRVVAVDHRGHGASPGPRGVIPHGDALWDDLAAVVDVERTVADGPLVLLGHSMGGLVAARFVAAQQRAVDALVLSSPALAGRLNAVQRVQLALGRRLAPDLALGNGLPPRYLSHDLGVVAAYLSDPLVHDRISARLAGAILDGAAAVHAAAPTWQVPTLLWWAGDDRFVDPAGSARFAAAAPAAVVTGRAIPEAYHELLNEPDRAQRLDELVAWLDVRFA